MAYKKPAFTIVELLVVIVVIGILAAITVISYTGVTNRAMLASIQSDLSNASKQLSIDQIATDNFPETLELANGGSGINPSQDVDSVLYIPDNISNPKDFCLMYRKGIITYAIDNDSQPTEATCLTNLVNNGDFSNGATGWINPGIPTVTTDSSLGRTALKFVATGNNPYRSVVVTSDQSHYWYTKIECYISSYTSGNISALDVRNADGGGLTVAYADSSKLNQWQTISLISTGKTGGGEYILIGSGNSYATATFYISNVSTIDLTAAFGAGNEPTKAEMDTIMSSFPNNWFSGTKKANF